MQHVTLETLSSAASSPNLLNKINTGVSYNRSPGVRTAINSVKYITTVKRLNTRQDVIH